MSYDLGFLGGGQLARMSIQAAQRMGLRCLSLDSGETTPASQIADSLVGGLSDACAIAKVFEKCERVTLENEFIPASSINEALRASGREAESLLPSTDALATIQDKLLQKQALHRSGVPAPKAQPLSRDSRPETFPVVLKTRFGGYDGKGTRFVSDSAALEGSADEWGRGGWMFEEYVRFRRELAVMVVLTPRYRYCFPTVETVQKDHVCDLVFPAEADASEIAIKAVEAVGGQGLFGVELFELIDGGILVNEIAPRPHNTGHYTLDWGGPSQFEAHVRAVLDLGPLDPRSERFAVMANLLGVSGDFELKRALHAVSEVPGVFAHWYGKAESRPGRKMGHLNAVGSAEPVKRVIERAVFARDRFFQAGLGR